MSSYHLYDFSLKVVLEKNSKKILAKNGANRTRVVTINKLSMYFVTKWYENRTRVDFVVSCFWEGEGRVFWEKLLPCYFCKCVMVWKLESEIF